MAVLYIPNYNEVNNFVEDGRARNKTARIYFVDVSIISIE